MANKFGLGPLKNDGKMPSLSTIINKSKPYFVDQIGDTLSGDIDMSDHSITNLKYPSHPKDAANKKYVNQSTKILHQKFSVLETNLQNTDKKISELEINSY